MTFKEKWELDHPGEKFSLTGHGSASWRCPYKCGYEKVDVDSNHCEMGCTACWNRQMPSLKSATMPFCKHDVEVPYSRRNPIEYADTAEFTNAELRILDSGDLRVYPSGAIRGDSDADGQPKGRCDLMPLRVLASIWRTFDTSVEHVGVDKAAVFDNIADFQDTGDTRHLVLAIHHFVGYLDYPTAFLEVAKHFEEGAKKYGENNWQKGLPVHRYIDSAVRHYLKWLRGDQDEPHDRAFVWNLICCIWEVDFSPRAMKQTKPNAEGVTTPEAGSGKIYICNRKPCDICRPDCHSTEHLGNAAVLEADGRAVRYEDCPIGLSRKFDADAMVHPIKRPFEGRVRL